MLCKKLSISQAQMGPNFASFMRQQQTTMMRKTAVIGKPEQICCSAPRAAAAGKLNVETRLLEAEGEFGLKGISDAIAHAAEAWDADLLVVGTKGRRGLERLVIGSVAEQLVSAVAASVLLSRSH